MAKIIVDIPEEEYNNFMFNESLDLDDGFDAVEYICNGIILDNVTNGDVIKAMFPNYRIQIGSGQVCLYYPVTEEYGGSWIKYDEEWWNAPYKADKEV